MFCIERCLKMYIYSNICTNRHMYPYRNTHMSICIYTSTYTYMYMYVYVYLCVCIHE